MEITLYIRYSFHEVKTCDLQKNALLAQLTFLRDVLFLRIRHRRLLLLLLLLSVVENVSFEIVFLRNMAHRWCFARKCKAFKDT